MSAGVLGWEPLINPMKPQYRSFHVLFHYAYIAPIYTPYPYINPTYIYIYITHLQMGSPRKGPPEVERQNLKPSVAEFLDLGCRI